MNKKAYWLIGGLFALIIGLFTVGIVLTAKGNSPETISPIVDSVPLVLTEKTPTATIDESKPAITHITTPSNVRALYMSAWVAATPSIRDKVINLIDTTNLNAVVVDIKDATGRVSFTVNDPVVADTGSPTDLIKNLPSFIQMLHDKNIYVIGRISTFQDPYLTKQEPEWAIKTISTGAVWKDHKGLSFLDPTNEQVWSYISHLAIASYEQGFDEINFDYIRFPSDGNIEDIAYPTTTRSDAMETFFIYLHDEMKKLNIPMSGDLFGLTTEATDDMGIGQVLEKALLHFDFIAPMIYPSHYASGYYGYKNPAQYPYEVVTSAMENGIARATAIGLSAKNFRPWIQDFDMGATYTAERVKDQIRALHDQGIDSYMVWDPANTYTAGAYEKN